MQHPPTPRWGAAWLCLGQLALICGEYEHADRFLLKGFKIERRVPRFGYFTGSSVLRDSGRPSGECAKARELCAAAAASLEETDHVYREAFFR